jgi:hypothetical protein
VVEKRVWDGVLKDFVVVPDGCSYSMGPGGGIVISGPQKQAQAVSKQKTVQRQKPVSGEPRKRGRPPLGERALTATERKRRYRARKKQGLV